MQRIDLFSIPVWRQRLPEFEPHAARVTDWVRRRWAAGDFKRHEHGYGYQTPSTLFDPESLAALPELAILKRAFGDTVLEILRQRVNHSVHLLPEIYAYMAWVLVQTSEDWVSGTWHDHAPALISACYYLQVPENLTGNEGALAFQRPAPADALVPQIEYVKPATGDFILFPSALTHRPQPCPQAAGLRITLAMDAYVHWRHWAEEGKLRIHPERYKRLLLDSL